MYGRRVRRDAACYRAFSSYTGGGIDTADVAAEFAKVANGKTILFPGAESSLRSIQQGLSPDTKIIDLPVYETVLDEDVEGTSAEVLVFTSPSNVMAYLLRTCSSQGRSDCDRQINRQKVRRNGDKLYSALRAG